MPSRILCQQDQCQNGKNGLEMAAADQELLRLRALQSRIIRSVASSTAIETRQPIHSIEAQLLAAQPFVINRRPVTLA